jgi:mRNA interferase MazF
MEFNIKRGDIYLIDLSPTVGSEQNGTRPCLVIQNDLGNRFSSTVIIAAITSKIQKAKLPTHVELKADLHKLDEDSVILLEQIRTIDKRRIIKKLGSLDQITMRRVDQALMISMDVFGAFSSSNKKLNNNKQYVTV